MSARKDNFMSHQGNQNQNYKETPLNIHLHGYHKTQSSKNNSQKITNAIKDLKKLEEKLHTVD